MRAKTILAVAIAVTAMTVSACSSGGGSGGSGGSGGDTSEKYVFGASVIGTAYPAVVTFDDGLQAAAKSAGAQLTIADGGAKASKQVDDVKDFTARGVTGLIVNPLDSASIEAPVKAAINAKIPVVTFGQVGNADCAYTGTVGNVEFDETGWATKQANETVTLLPNGGKVAIISGLAGLASTKIRDDVYKQGLSAHSNITVVADQPGDFSADKARAAMENMLQANPDINLVYAADDTMAVAAVQAIKAANKGGQIKVLGIGGSKSALAAIQAGDMTATVWSSLEEAGGDMITMLTDHISGKSTQMEQCVKLPQVLVDSTNIAQYIDKGQF